MTELVSYLQSRIEKNGPITISDYMETCLFHPKLGYYQKKNPLGQSGDFVTAPEISQMFGELLCIWAITEWRVMGEPCYLNLVELGPGRGTLMADFMRVAMQHSDFFNAINIHLIEISPMLREVQQTKLSRYNCAWHMNIDEVPEGPLLVIANEFFDVFPIHQFQLTKSGWCERLVRLKDNHRVQFELSLSPYSTISLINKKHKDLPVGSVFEISPLSSSYFVKLVNMMSSRLSSAIIIDYGYTTDDVGDSLQAIKCHRFDSIFLEPGNADLSSHVNFRSFIEMVKCIAKLESEIFTQQQFLSQTGIQERTSTLLKNASSRQAEVIESAFNRLMGASEMGELFKVLFVCNRNR